MHTDIIVFGEDWGGHPSSTQHLIRQLMKDRKIIWVDSLGLRRPKISLNDFRRAKHKVTAMFGRRALPSETDVMERSDSPTVLAPKILPFPGNSLARWVNRLSLTSMVNKAMQEQDITANILWISLPTAVDMIGQFSEVLSVYYCGDDFSALAGVDHKAVTALECELVERVDVIIAASDELAKKFPAHKTHVIPHGVDFEKFTVINKRPEDLPKGKPIAGFYGSISQWLDLELMVETAKIMPDWNFVFIGPVSTDIIALKALKNVFFLGPKKHHELSAYVQHWQVSMLPFKRNRQIQACNPLKLREYLAVGKPIVSTEFPALHAFREFIHVLPKQCNADHFKHTLQCAAADLSSLCVEKLMVDDEGLYEFEIVLKRFKDRRASVADESWHHHSQTIKTLFSAN
ncbi:MAG: glycosyltransferase [Pseudomonadales bacterium]|nr:glycosyltransferase [Pseudomonadales bacterium]